MNTKALKHSTDSIHYPELEEMITKKDAELKELARKDARHFAKQNLPVKEAESMAPYIDGIKAGYEHLASQVFQFLQPAAHFPEAKMDADYYRETDKGLDEKIKSQEDANRHSEYELGDFNSGSIILRIWLALIASLIINVGETIFTTKSFQVTGENMLFALILSICVSFAVFVFSHVATFLYKSMKTTLQRRLVAFGTFFLATGLFTALAIFRSSYLANHDVHINPFYFVIINLFFFIVSVLLSFFVLPTWQEIKENASRIKLAYTITKRKKEIEKLQKEKEEIRKIILERTKNRMRIAHYANYAAQRIRKLYFETVGVFKSTNLTFRTDKQIPDGFSERIMEPDINDFEIIFNSPVNTKTK